MSYKQFDADMYRQDLQYAPFHVAEIFSDVDDQYWFCESLVTDITNEHAPVKSWKVRPRKPPFLN